MTPQVGKELTKHKLNRLNETWIVLKNLFSIRPVRIRREGRTHSYNSLVFSSIGTMSKYLTLSTEASATDGKFELTATKDDSIVRLFRHLLRAAFNRVESTPQYTRYTFTALRNMHIQLDGEIYTILSGETVTVSCEREALTTII
jgi:diacylglycerol kinase family enzyme